VDWLAAREAIAAAQRRHDDTGETPRILLINGSSRSEHTCPGEMSKTWRLIKSAEPVFQEMGFAVDILDLSAKVWSIHNPNSRFILCVSLRRGRPLAGSARTDWAVCARNSGLP
jgi:hypothetical protein